MDRSFLSKPEVIAASRAFVCVRLATYEDAAEAAFLKALFVGRSGEVENSVFCVLGPDGKERLTKAGRSPRHFFADAGEMAQALRRIAAARPGRLPGDGSPPGLPTVASVRLALDVAACDNQPLAIVVGPDGVRQKLEATLAEFAWRDDFIGRFTYAAAAGADDLKQVEGSAPGAGVLVVQHDQFGLSGKVLCQLGPEASSAQIAKAMRASLERYHRYAKTFKNHVDAGHRLGIFWETTIPVTDPMERNARERGKLKAGKKE